MVIYFKNTNTPQNKEKVVTFLTDFIADNDLTEFYNLEIEPHLKYSIVTESFEFDLSEYPNVHRFFGLGEYYRVDAIPDMIVKNGNDVILNTIDAHIIRDLDNRTFIVNDLNQSKALLVSKIKTYTNDNTRVGERLLIYWSDLYEKANQLI